MGHPRRYALLRFPVLAGAVESQGRALHHKLLKMQDFLKDINTPKGWLAGASQPMDLKR
jgi:hypothetical protein